ncbi:MAG: hypothetical protein RL086_1125 [Bacteroidota bacterium]|jgi:hypothetical protein
MIICHKSFSQKSKTESREIQEIKLIYKDIINKKLRLPFYLPLDDGLTLPAYFTNYRKYYDEKNKFERIDLPDFDLTNGLYAKLNKSDCDKLNSSMLNDTIHLKIQKKWFTNDKIKILSDSITKTEMYVSEHLKPIFFRNYTRCFIAILPGESMESFFIKKKNNHWVLDKTWVRWIKD